MSRSSEDKTALYRLCPADSVATIAGIGSAGNAEKQLLTFVYEYYGKIGLAVTIYLNRQPRQDSCAFMQAFSSPAEFRSRCKSMDGRCEVFQKLDRRHPSHHLGLLGRCHIPLGRDVKHSQGLAHLDHLVQGQTNAIRSIIVVGHFVGST